MTNTNTNTLTLTTSTLGRVTFDVMADRDRWNDPSSLRCHLVCRPFDFKYGGIDYPAAP